MALADINPAALSTVRGEIEAAGGKAVGIQVDLSHVAEIQRLVKQTVAELGQLDALVNNAGRQITKPFLDVTEAVSFLCSPDAAYITGQALNVCGGMEMD